MKRLFLFVCMFSGAGLLISAPAYARGSGGNDNPAVEQSLMQMERDWADAVMKNDIAGIDRIEADDFSYILENMPGDKQTDLASARAAEINGSAELTDMKARVFGDAAVVTGKTALRNATFKGKGVSGIYLFTDVFVKRNGRWQVVASHANKVHTM
jgi:ketosteroid isomerase-like protein